MISAFCPAHITCFFQPVDSKDLKKKGSRGAGIRLDKGTHVTLERNSSDNVEIIMDGTVSSAPISLASLREIIPEGGFRLTISNDLPLSQGFGMSAAGAIATGLCACNCINRDVNDAYTAAHISEIRMGGGLGDVAGLRCNGSQPFRLDAGILSDSLVDGTGIKFEEITLAVLGPKISTESILNNSEYYNTIQRAGKKAIEDFKNDISKDNLFRVSNEFSANTGLDNETIQKSIKMLRAEGINSAMCMLGNSIFIDAPEYKVKDILDEGIQMFSCFSSDQPASLK